MPFVARPVPFVASCRPGPPARRHPFLPWVATHRRVPEETPMTTHPPTPHGGASALAPDPDLPPVAAPEQKARWTLPKILLWAGIALHLPERRADSTG